MPLDRICRVLATDKAVPHASSDAQQLTIRLSEPAIAHRTTY